MGEWVRVVREHLGIEGVRLGQVDDGDGGPGRRHRRHQRTLRATGRFQDKQGLWGGDQTVNQGDSSLARRVGGTTGRPATSSEAVTTSMTTKRMRWSRDTPPDWPNHV